MALDAADWHRFDTPPLRDEHVAMLMSFAGPKVFERRRIWAGDNCAWIVWNFLVSLGYRWKEHFQWTPPPRPAAYENLEAAMRLGRLDEFRRNVKGVGKTWPEYVMPWQAAMPTFANRSGLHLWWVPGAGKSLGAYIWAAPHPGAIIYVTRSSVRHQIAAEVRRYTYMEPFVLSGEQPMDIPPNTRTVIVGWEVLPFHIDTLERLSPTTAIFDESHRAKSWKRRIAIPKRGADGKIVIGADGAVVNEFERRNNRASAAERLSRVVRRRLATTGSPLPDGRIRDLWGQLDLVEPEQWGHFYKTFTPRYADAKEGTFGGIDTRGRSPQPFINELIQRLNYSVNYVPYDVAHASLPAKRREVIYVPKDELLKDIGKEARDALKEAAQRGASSLAWARMAMTAVQKRPHIVEWIKERAEPSRNGAKGSKFVIVTGLRGEARKLYEALRKALPDDFPMWFGTGDEDSALRERSKDAYMAAPAGAIVGTMDAWGESYNLQDTDYAVAAMLPYTPKALIQWEGRFFRLEQTRPCLLAYFLGEGTYDEHVGSLLYGKFDTIDLVAPAREMEGFGRQIVGIANEEELVDSIIDRLSSNTVYDEEGAR